VRPAYSLFVGAPVNRTPNLYEMDIAHVALNLGLSTRPVAQILEQIGREPDLL
jgi:hypothetical protein